MAASRGARRRRWPCVVERTDLPGTPPVARPARRAAGRARVRQQLRAGCRSTARVHGLRRRAADHHAVLLPARLPAVVATLRGLDPALEESACVARPQPLAHLPAGRAAAAAAGAARRLAARRPAPARRVRRAPDAALPDLHHRDLRPVRLHVQRRRRQHDRRRPGALLPAPAARRAAAARPPPVRPASATAPPAAAVPVAARRRGAGRCSVPSAGARGARGRRPDLRAWCTGCAVGSSTEFPLGELAAATGATVAPRRRRRGRHDAVPRCRSPGSPCATAAAASTADRAQHLRRQRAARHRRRRWPSSRSSLRLVPADLPDRRCCCVAAYAILFLPRAVVSVRAGARAGARRCSTTSRTASAPVRSRPHAG